MTRKRKRTVFRTPAQRTVLWDRKMDASVYSEYLTRTKPLARKIIEKYQVEHEQLIRIVKDVIDEYPSEYGRTQAYVWFAQGIYYAKHRYSSEALQKEVDAEYMYWLVLGLRDDVMRKIAERMGVIISDINTIMKKLGIVAGMSEDVVYRGTKKALQETLHLIDVNLTDVQYEYDPSTGNLVKITGKDLITGKTKIIHFEWDANGNLIRKWEEWV